VVHKPLAAFEIRSSIAGAEIHMVNSELVALWKKALQQESELQVGGRFPLEPSMFAGSRLTTRSGAGDGTQMDGLETTQAQTKACQCKSAGVNGEPMHGHL
jgi:hypothetical protein